MKKTQQSAAIYNIEKSLSEGAVPVNAEEYLQGLSWFFGSSAIMRNLYQLLVQLGSTKQPIMISGEVGTGKSLIARSLHVLSGRKGRFVTFDVSSLPVNHIAQSLAVAIEDAYASGASGTLYVLGIDLLPLPAQKQLLEQCQKMSAELSPRIVSCSRQPLDQLVEDGRFLEALHKYVTGVTVMVPSLRERPQDLVSMASYMGSLHSKRKRQIKFTTAASHFIESYSWPGNLREMLNVMQHVVTQVKTGAIDEQHVRKHLSEMLGQQGNICLPEAADMCLRQYFASLKGISPPPNLHHRVMAEVEKPLLEQVLKHAKGNQLRASEILGLNRNTLRKKMRDLSIDPKTGKDI